MTDEPMEEFASLYVLGLLEGLELEAFEAQLGRDPALRELVRQLTEASSSLAFSAPEAAPPPALRSRLLNRIAPQASAQASAPRDAAARTTRAKSAANVVPFTLPQWIPLAAVAGLAVTCAWLGQLYLAARSENILLREQQAVADFALKSARHQLEAERIIARQEIANATSQLAAQDKSALFAKQEAERANQLLASAQKLIAARDLQLAQEAQRAADLEARARREADLANFKISTLASLLGNSPQALAVAVWNPARQEGVLRVEKLPPLAPNQDYQLWLVDPQYPIPVDGGVFTVDPATGEARVNFKADRPVKTVAKFAVSLEKKGGVPKAEGPMVLISQ